MVKITPTMIESGVAALARIKRQHPVDASVVATVFSAMYHAYEIEQKRLAGIVTTPPYQHQAWPAWRYSPEGDGEMFDCAEDVPEGWSDHPPAVHAEKRRPGRPPKVRDAQPPVA